MLKLLELLELRMIGGKGVWDVWKYKRKIKVEVVDLMFR